jgi:hypothetical protein
MTYISNRVFVTVIILALLVDAGIVYVENQSAINTTSSTSTSVYRSWTAAPFTGPGVLFPPKVMKSDCPNLPRADELTHMGGIAIIPRNAVGDKIWNYSGDAINYFNGQVQTNFMHIFVSNGTYWVTVPQDILNSTGCTAALMNYISTQQG